MLSPTVQLRSGGYLVINQTEALVAIDVNSGRSTRERGIEETALRTNTEAAEEAARQLRLRDLAGLIVIDFIDMESRKNNAIVERRLTEALKVDRARIQVGHISHFGLLEMSRQRLRPSLAETSFVTCPHCGGTGHVRGTESAAIHVLRDIEEEGAKRRAAEILVRVAAPIAMYILNHKRARLAEIEARYAMQVTFAGDDSLIPPQVRIERVRAQAAIEAPAAITPDARAEPEPVAARAARVEDEPEDEDVDGAEGVQAEAERRASGGRPGRRAGRDQRGGRSPPSPSSPPPAGRPARGRCADARRGDRRRGDRRGARPGHPTDPPRPRERGGRPRPGGPGGAYRGRARACGCHAGGRRPATTRRVAAGAAGAADDGGGGMARTAPWNRLPSRMPSSRACRPTPGRRRPTRSADRHSTSSTFWSRPNGRSNSRLPRHRKRRATAAPARRPVQFQPRCQNQSRTWRRNRQRSWQRSHASEPAPEPAPEPGASLEPALEPISEPRAATRPGPCRGNRSRPRRCR